MPLLRYLTHPQVRIDPAVPVPHWGLSEIGRARTEALAQSGKLAGTTRICSSGETKAIETAEIVATSLGLEFEIREAMHENDRSATGFLPPPEFEKVANLFFANPTLSIRGWERAIDAQARIVREASTVLGDGAAGNLGDILLVGHGGVGTLLLLHYAKMPIARIHDQPPGGGNLFSVDRLRENVVHSWRSIEEFIAT
jgi:broad specificity phosphatase PhoE